MYHMILWCKVVAWCKKAKAGRRPCVAFVLLALVFHAQMQSQNAQSNGAEGGAEIKKAKDTIPGRTFGYPGMDKGPHPLLRPTRTSSSNDPRAARDKVRVVTRKGKGQGAAMPSHAKVHLKRAHQSQQGLKVAMPSPSLVPDNLPNARKRAVRSEKSPIEAFFYEHHMDNCFEATPIFFMRENSSFEATVSLDSILIGGDRKVILTATKLLLCFVEDSIALAPTCFNQTADGRLRITLPPDLEAKGLYEDSFIVKARFNAEYLTEGSSEYLTGDRYFQGWVKAHMNSAHLPKGFRVNLLHLAVLVAIVLVFSGLILWMSRVPKSLIHLRESKFENPRRKRNQEALKFGNRIETHPIIIIKSEKNDDLIEVFFKPGSQQDIFGQSKGHVQLPYTIKATVPVPGGRIRLFFKRMYAIMLSHVTPLPENRKLVRFIKWAPFSFLRSAAQPFKTQYHSLRVIIGRSFQLDGIKAKDLGGLLLIETCLSRGKLANDLQNFPINVSEFTYRLFLDPQELILGECRSRPYTLDVSVVEEPFEGFVLLREFALNFSIMEVPPSLENIGSEK